MSKQKLQFHEAANIFPLMKDVYKDGEAEKRARGELPGAWEAFLNDVRLKGVIEPVMIHRRKILDGRNRYLAWLYWTERGVQLPPLPTQEFTGTDHEALHWVLSKNLHRRDLTSSQRAAIAFLAHEMDSRYRHHKAANGANGVPAGRVAWDQAEQYASQIGTNRDYVFKARYIAEHNRSLLMDVAVGKMSLMRAFYAISKPGRDERIESLRERLRDVRLMYQELGAKSHARRVLRLLKDLDELKEQCKEQSKKAPKAKKPKAAEEPKKASEKEP